MTEAPALKALGRKLRLGVLGGGPGSFIGTMHRAAATLDGRFEIVASVLSGDSGRSRQAGHEFGVPRPYGAVDEMIAAEATRGDSIDAIAIMTPNDAHYRECRAALDAGLDIVCDKPLTNTLAEASDLARRTREAQRVLCVTHAYAAYPMVRQARAMVAAGAIGELRAAQVEYVQSGMATRVEDGALTPKLRWKLAPERSGPSLVLGDIGTHAHHLLCYVAGRPVERLAADVGAVVPGRNFDDYAAMTLRLQGDVRATLVVSQAFAGTENNITLRIVGERGLIAWSHDDPNHLRHALLGEPVRILARGDPGLLPPAARLVRISRGHPEGLLEAFANLYRDAAELMAARRTGLPADPLAADFPTADDGAAGLAFIEAAIASARQDGAWVACGAAS
jgi:predicted dehydrogenase